MGNIVVKVTAGANYQALSSDALRQVGVRGTIHTALQVAVAHLFPGGELKTGATFTLQDWQVKDIAESFQQRRATLTPKQKNDLFVRRLSMAFLYPGDSLLEVARGMVRNHVANAGSKPLDEDGELFRSMTDLILQVTFEENGIRPTDSDFTDPETMRVNADSLGMSIVLPNPLYLFSPTDEPLLPIYLHPDWEEAPPGEDWFGQG